MKISRLFMFGFLAFGLLTFMTSCEGEDGTDGMDGMDGAIGAQGPAGVDGQDGNANVVSVTFDAYSIVTGANEFTIPEITQDIYDHGVVLGYVTVNGNQFWETVPVVISQDVLLDFDRIYVGGLRLVSTFNQLLDFRFVIIEGTPATRSALGSNTDLKAYYEDLGVDFNDYEAVKEFFDL